MTRSRLTVVVLLAVLGLALSLVVVRLGERPAVDATSVPTAAVPADVPADVPAADVLRAWDEQRAAAYARGSVRELRQLYVAGSAAALADVQALRGYRARGLAVEGMRTQVLALRVVEQRPGRLRLQVTDRLVGAVAVGRDVRVPLPRDRSDVRMVTLTTADDGAWRVAAVRTVR
ncbi:MAG: hypothetical protein ABIQ59_07720 [Nocardioidaceae bacterium]